MGCCHSHPEDTEGSETSNGRRVARAHNNDTSRGVANHTSSNSSVSPRQQNTAHPPPSSSSRPNQPIRAPSPVSKSPKNVSNQPPPWTRSHLEKERQAFFDTRVTGQVESWSALQLVCELLRAGEVKQAQGILDAANFSCPNGRIAKGRGRDRQKGGVYDERGELYDLPEWVVSDPKDIVEDGLVAGGEGEGDDGEKDVGPGAEEEAFFESEDEDLKSQQQRMTTTTTTTEKPRDSKGKGRAADVGEEMRVRCRLSSSARDVEIVLGSREAVGLLVGRLQERIGKRRVKLVYLGRPLDVGRTLEAQGWQAGHVINVLVLE